MKKPVILGILNVTRDSFSDGGLYFDFDNAFRQAQSLIRQGADIIDIGPASTHPDAEFVDSDEEISRIVKLIDSLHEQNISVSIDSYQTETQRFALSKKVAYLNDVQGFSDKSFYSELAESNCKMITMHAVQRQGKAQRIALNSKQVWESIISFFEQRLEFFQKERIELNRVIIDPGMGFFLSSNPEPSFFVLNRISDLKKYFNLPVLISVSRKSFLQVVTGRETKELNSATLTAELIAFENGADYIRTHDVLQLSDAIKIKQAAEDFR